MKWSVTLALRGVPLPVGLGSDLNYGVDTAPLGAVLASSLAHVRLEWRQRLVKFVREGESTAVAAHCVSEGPTRRVVWASKRSLSLHEHGLLDRRTTIEVSVCVGSFARHRRKSR